MLSKAEILRNGINQYFDTNVKETAEYCRVRFQDEIEQTICLADQICDNSFIFNLRWDMEQTHIPVKFDDEINWEFQPYDDNEWIFALNRHRYWISLGQAYSLTQDPKYAKTFAYQINHWIENATSEQTTTTWRTIEVGLRCEYWLKALQHFVNCEFLTDVLLEKIYDSLIEHAQVLLLADRDFATISNWGILENHGLINVGVVLSIANYVDAAKQRLELQARIQIMADGTHWEQSPMYHNEVLHCLLDAISIAKKAGITFSDEFMGLVYKASLVNLKWKKPNHNEFLQGDSDDFDLRDMLTLSAYIFNDGVLKFGGYNELDFQNVWELGKAGIDTYDRIVTANPDFVSAFLSDSGNYYLRSSWQENANTLHFSCGTLGGGHGHNEKLHFDLSAKGEDIIVDSGRFTYVDTPQRLELKSASAHNAIVMDDIDFMNCTNSWGHDKLASPIMANYYTDNRYDFVEGGHLGYIDSAVFINRKIIFIKPDIYVICDEIHSSQPHKFSSSVHFNNDGNVSLKDNIARYTGENVIVDLHFLNYNSLEIIDTKLSKFYNKLEDNKTIKADVLTQGNSYNIFVVDIFDKDTSSNAKVELISASSVGKTRGHHNSDIGAVKILKNDIEYVVVISHNETWSDVNLVLAGGYKVRGNVVVVSSEDEYKCGTVLKN